MIFRRYKNKKVANTPTFQTWVRFRGNKIAMSGFIIIIIASIVAILGYLITPDPTPFSNDMILQISTKPPGFRITMLKIRRNKHFTSQFFLKTMLFGRENTYNMVPINSYSFEGNNIIVSEYTGGTDLNSQLRFPLTEVVYTKSVTKPHSTIKGDSVCFYDLDEKCQTVSIKDLQNVITNNQIVQKFYLLGTDKFGRDILSRLIIGVRVSLSVGFIAVLISLVIGITLGAIAGYYRGKVDDVVMWFINVIWSIPTLLLVFAITLALGKGFWQIFVAVGLTMWVEVARIIRGQFLSIREIEFVEAAKALGFSNLRIIARHILPNVLGPVIVIAAANFAAAIIVEAGLSFLGIGVQPPIPSWGTMIKEHYGYIIANDPFLAIVPGIAIMFMVLAFYLVGNGMRDALDVKTQIDY